jgi:hypothetical protein
MDQFYASQNRSNTDQSGLLAALSSGYYGAQSQLGSFAGGLGRNLRDTNAQMGNAFGGLQGQLGSLAGAMGAGFGATQSQMGAGFGDAMGRLGSGYDSARSGINSGLQQASSQIGQMNNDFRNDAQRFIRNMTNNPTLADMQERWEIEDARNERIRSQREGIAPPTRRPTRVTR